MAEGNFGKSQEFKGGPSGGGKKDDKPDKHDPKDHDDPKGKKNLNKFDRMGRFDREQESSHGDSQEAMEVEMECEGVHEELQGKALPIAAFHPVTGIIQIDVNTEKALVCNHQTWDPTSDLLQKCSDERSDQTAQADTKQGVMQKPAHAENHITGHNGEEQVPENKIVVHGREGTYLMDKDKWPKLVLPDVGEGQMVDSEPEIECVTQID